jgi:hypothetical protein
MLSSKEALDLQETLEPGEHQEIQELVPTETKAKLEQTEHQEKEEKKE